MRILSDTLTTKNEEYKANSITCGALKSTISSLFLLGVSRRTQPRRNTSKSQRFKSFAVLLDVRRGDLKYMKNKLFAGFLIAGLGVLAFATLAGAETSSTVTTTVKNAIKANFNQKIEVNSNGQAQIRGTVVGTSTNSVMVKTWGGIWTAEISTGTMILAEGGKAELKDLKSGDQVAVHGKMVDGKAITIAAKVIKDYSLRLDKKTSESKETKKSEAKNEVKKSIAERIKSLPVLEKLSNGPSVEIKISGNVICLPKKNPGEVQTMECAIGLQADGKNYGLTGEDARELEVGKSVTVAGKLLPAGTSTIYDIVGIIKVSDSE